MFRREVAIPWHGRLEARVLAAGVAVSAICLVTVLVAAERLVTNSELRQTHGQLQSTKSIVDQLLDNRSSSARAQLQLIAELPVFRAVLTDLEARADAPTMNAMAEHYRDQLKADVCLITDPSGVPIGTAAVTEVGLPRFDAEDQDPNRLQVVLIGTDLYLVISEAAMFLTEELGVMTAAYRLSDELATDLARLTNTDVSFVTGERVVSSSLEPGVRSEIRELPSVTPDSASPVASLQEPAPFGDRRYIVGHYPLPTADVDAELVGSLLLMADWTPTEQLLADMRSRLLWAATGVFVLAIGAMIVFSRRVSGHMRVIAGAARDITAGNLSRKVPRTGSAEATQLADAFNDMTTAMLHWRDQAEARLARLQVAHDRFSTVTQSASDAIVSVDDNGQISFWNPGAQKLFGYSDAEVDGKSFVSLIAAADRPTCLSLVEHLTDSAGPNPDATIRDIEAVRTDGSQFIAELSMAPWRSEDGAGVTVVMRDATARVVSQRHLQDARDAAEKASQAKSGFVASVSHELRTPLHAIIGYTELLLEDAEARGEDETTGDLQRIKLAGQQLLQLINAVLDLSRVEAGKVTLDIHAFDVRAMAREAVATVTPLAEKNHNTLEHFAHEHVAEMVGDRRRVSQLLLQLLSNAAKFTENGNIRLDVTREVSGDADQVVFRVSDTGIGMTPEQTAEIFGEFFQVDSTSTRRYRGTGIGLAVSRRLARLMGGDITAESELGRGSVVSLVLPVETEEPADRPSSPATTSIPS